MLLFVSTHSVFRFPEKGGLCGFSFPQVVCDIVGVGMRKVRNQGTPNIGMCVSRVPLASILHGCGLLGSFNCRFQTSILYFCSALDVSLVLNIFINTE